MNYLIADAVVLFPSLHAVLTTLAVLMIVWGQFETDRIHDEGAIVDHGDVDNEATTATTAPNQPNNNNMVQDVYTALSGDSTVEGRKLQALWRGPAGRPLRIAVAGWMLLVVSVFVDASAYAGFAVNRWYYALGHVVVVLWLLVTQAVILPLQVADQAVHENSIFFGCAALLGYSLWAVVLRLDVGGVSLAWSLASAVLITASWYAFWYQQRKRGDSYDRCGVERNGNGNGGAVLFSWGGPLLAAGWCGVWLSLNAVHALPASSWYYIGIYWTRRAQCALLGVALVTAAQWAVDYAHDEYHIESTAGAGAQTDLDTAVADNNNNNSTQTKQQNKVFLLNGVLEIRIVYYVSWCVLALTAFLPTYAAQLHLATALFAAIALQGYATSQQHIAGLRAGSERAYTKWQRAVWFLYLVIAILTACHSGFWAFLLSAVGVVVQQVGRRLLHRDRKRGAHWMSTQTINNSGSAFTVYSYGVLLVPTGMLIWAWGLSMP